MSRIAIELFERRLRSAYKDDPFHAFRRNVESVRAEEWNRRPATWSVEEFGERPELSVLDLVLHVGGAMYMYADRAFGPAKLDWGDIAPPAAFDMATVLAYADTSYGMLMDGLAALTDDAQLEEERQAPWRTPMSRAALLSLVTNHALYHSGEVNRQRALLRGAQGWD